jgi:hypothetical protein
MNNSIQTANRTYGRIGPNEIGIREGEGWAWYGVGDYEDLDVTMEPRSRKLTVNVMEFLYSEDGECVDPDGECVETYKGDHAIFFLSKRGVKHLLAGDELFTIAYSETP